MILKNWTMHSLFEYVQWHWITWNLYSIHDLSVCNDTQIYENYFVYMIWACAMNNMKFTFIQYLSVCNKDMKYLLRIWFVWAMILVNMQLTLHTWLECVQRYWKVRDVTYLVSVCALKYTKFRLLTMFECLQLYWTTSNLYCMHDLCARTFKNMEFMFYEWFGWV